MKILILSQSRSGSTTLYSAIKSKLSLPELWEPFHYTRDGDLASKEQEFATIVNAKDIVVKIIDNHFYSFHRFSNHTDITQYFDKVVGLTRENDEENAKSFFLAERDNTWMNYSIKGREVDTSTEKYLRILDRSEKVRKEILSFDIFQVTYEGLFIRKDQMQGLEDYLGFSIKDTIDFFK